MFTNENEQADITELSILNLHIFISLVKLTYRWLCFKNNYFSIQVLKLKRIYS